MRPIYLASDSEARKKLLNIFGLKFKAVPSRIKEERKACLSYAVLVKKNALEKAREVAQRMKKGIVIGADTIVVQDKKIFGKPKDLRDAKIMLKRLSRKPQWLYTGLAIIDVDKHKTIVDYEKTKVYMDKLTDNEINKYFSHFSPLGKAGSFDIQAKGAFFIRRIEGCFYNVVGLPLRKLFRMLRDLDIKVFNFLLVTLCLGVLVTFITGCSTEYNIVTGKEETFYYSTDKEVQIGKSIAREVEKKYKLADDPLVQKRAEDIGKKIVNVCDRKDIDYNFKVLDDEEVNAVSLPGGFIYVNKGLIDKIDNDDELACILGHEIGHIVARHSIKKLQAIMGYSILRILTASIPQGGQVGNVADIAFTEIMLGYARDDELLADRLASRYAKLAGYNPYSMIEFIEKLQEINRRKPLRPKNYFKTHPYASDRIRIVKQELGEKMDFDDYINIEEKKDE
ncbi:MAG: Maf and M48 domain-containing protein [Candidatus Omnitrophica bacterium]|nr:Maf and M48 domain-containing protein [Candidatus Omnitrophota bacterium]